MYILSQDKSKIVETTGSIIKRIDNVISIETPVGSINLGAYETDERAIKIFNNLVSVFDNGKYNIYQMQKE